MHEFSNSVAVTEPLVKSILKQTVENTVEIKAQQKVTQRCVREENRRIKEEQMTATLDSLTSNTHKALFWHKRRGQASTWLGTGPMKEHGFVLHKRAFKDALTLRYGWQPNEIPNSIGSWHRKLISPSQRGGHIPSTSLY